MWGDQFCVAEIQPEGAGEASAGERIGQPLSHESAINSGADAVSEAQGNMIGLAIAKCPIGPAWPETLACADDNLIWMKS